ncbi:MAG: methylenetetrahydrofolate reductase [NAD(P)H] [Gammaproteobacteria bacterium]|nr:methylenetetrahydrofolate reductase [NAD(P)H] [Gammaproteobacteria bacterium]
MSTNNDNKPVFSCEFFPPRTDAGMEKLIATQQRLKDTINPAFFSVTFGAGGSTRDRTLETVKQLRHDSSQNVAPHISCIGSSKQQLADLLDEYISLGINRLVTLRGDIPEHGKLNNQLAHASDLVAFIREKTGDHFHIEIAAYPEYHPESPSPEDDFRYFLNKARAGADSAITQYFYNIDAYHRFVDKCEQAQLNIPVVPGIMPITNYTNLVRFSDTCGAEIPRWIRKQLEAYADDLESLRDFGTDIVSQLCNRLLEAGAPGLHFYSLNQANATLSIWDKLNR